MKKANRTMGRHRWKTTKRGAGDSRAGTLRVKLRWLAVACAAIVCLGLFTSRNGAEQVDSGWAVASPSPFAKGSKHNLQQELVLRHVLEQTQQPILQAAPKPQNIANKSESGQVEHVEPDVRFAARPEKAAVDGWRAALGIGPSLAPAGESHSTSNATTPLSPPTSSTKRGNELEFDCNGIVEAVPRKSGAAFTSSAAVPGLEASSTADEKPAINQPIDEAIEEEEVEEDAAVATKADDNSPTAVESTASQPTDVSAPAPPAANAAKAESQRPQPAPAATAKAAPAANSLATSSPPADITPVTELPPLSRQMIGLKNRVRAVLKGYYRKPLASRENDPWEVMHGMLAYGVHSRIHDGGQNGQLITSVGWLCYNKPCKGQTLLYVTPSGELRAKYGVGLQGHLGQFLAMLAQCHVSPDYPIRVGGHEYTIADLIEAEKKTCYPKSELTFKLIALQHYADLNDTWVNDQGIEWDFPRLIREELAQPIRGAACGGTHRLSGLSLVVKARQRRGEPLDGEYQKANDFVKKYQQYAFRLQNRDGSLSTSWFRGAGDENDDDRRIKTTGHILEWLCYSLSDEQLREPQTVRAVTYLANLMYNNYNHNWEIGPRGHATHALLLYDQRVFQPYDKEGEVASFRPNTPVARKSQSNSGGGVIRR